MKKLFVSCPMKGRTEANIRKSINILHVLAEDKFNQKLELIETYIEDKPPVDSRESIWYLGKSLEKLSQADYFIGIDMNSLPKNFNGCITEYDVAVRYGIPTCLLDARSIVPDIFNDVNMGLDVAICDGLSRAIGLTINNQNTNQAFSNTLASHTNN